MMMCWHGPQAAVINPITSGLARVKRPDILLRE